MEIKDIRDLIRFSDEKMQKVPVFDSGRYFCDVYCLKPGQEQRPHSHAESEKIYYVLEGMGRFLIGDQTGDLTAGQAVVARAGEPHGVRNDSAGNLTLLVYMTPKP